MDIKIAVATHKKYWMPEDDVYLPLHVGKALHEHLELGYTGDNTGDNISEKNESFCELTGLYWMWKNVQADYKGLVHYRRHFTKGRLWQDKKLAVFRREDFVQNFQQADILLPKLRKYYIETNESHYVHAHYQKDLQITRQVIAEQCSEYLLAYDQQMKRTSAHMFNMMTMRADLFDAYCQWLFDVLFEVEKRTDIRGYDAVQRRLYGYLSELLLDVWLETNSLSYKENSVTFMEPQNWLKKGGKFLLRKFKGRSC
ncbi:DUF4422 domain-containing protein [Selenomonas ruminantium]|uniref:DUF4422 domain-containing protein n=1 Tax=Selenomonas ruminantium TaxID=971 RepID=UPI00047A6DD4|nr:DUF4422 domain-containing protein [Selenomonas ruminantium]